MNSSRDKLEDEIVFAGLLAVAGLAACRRRRRLSGAGSGRPSGIPCCRDGRFPTCRHGAWPKVGSLMSLTGIDIFSPFSISVIERPLIARVDRVLDLALVAPQKAFAVDRGLVLALQTPVDEVSQNASCLTAMADVALVASVDSDRASGVAGVRKWRATAVTGGCADGASTDNLARAGLITASLAMQESRALDYDDLRTRRYHSHSRRTCFGGIALRHHARRRTPHACSHRRRWPWH